MKVWYCKVVQHYQGESIVNSRNDLVSIQNIALTLCNFKMSCAFYSLITARFICNLTSIWDYAEIMEKCGDQ